MDFAPIIIASIPGFITLLLYLIDRRKRLAEASEKEASGAKLLSEAAENLAPLYSDQVNLLRYEVTRLRDEVRLLEQRLSNEIEKRRRAEAIALDAQTQVKRVEQEATRLRTRVAELEAAQEASTHDT